MRRVTDDERRARIAIRHALEQGNRVRSPLAAAEAMTALHATEAATVYLSIAARTDGVTIDDIDGALYRDRTLVKQLAMRRTLFAFPTTLLPAARGSAAARVAAQERARLARDVVRSGLADDGEAWLDRAGRSVVRYLRRHGPASARQIRSDVPAVSGTVEVAPGTTWGGEIPLVGRVLGWLGATGQIVRANNLGHWRTSRPTWTLSSSWLERLPRPLSAELGYRHLVDRWLRTFGPGTTADIAWWLGGTLAVVRRALAELDAIEVRLDDGQIGWMHADDASADPPPAAWAALLPALDSTTMGWKGRSFYLANELAPAIFDAAGNAGTTAWWNGRIVGCWVQDGEGVVKVSTSVELSDEARSGLEDEAGRLSRWLDGVRVTTLYNSAAMKTARERLGPGGDAPRRSADP